MRTGPVLREAKGRRGREREREFFHAAKYYHARVIIRRVNFGSFTRAGTRLVERSSASAGRGLEEARRVYYNTEIEDLRLYITYRDKRPLERAEERRASYSSSHEPARPLRIYARRAADRPPITPPIPPLSSGSPPPLIAKTSAIAYYSRGRITVITRSGTLFLFTERVYPGAAISAIDEPVTNAADACKLRRRWKRKTETGRRSTRSVLARARESPRRESSTLAGKTPRCGEFMESRR